MAQPKATRSPAEVEDIILRRIFQVTIGSGEHKLPVVYLEQSAATIQGEGRPLLLSRDIMERVLSDRLSAVYVGTEPPFEYLVQCYRRAQEEGRKVPSMKDKKLVSEMENVVKEGKQLALAYSRIVFASPELFPQASPQQTSPLLGLLWEGSAGFGLDVFGGSSVPGIIAPPGFLDDFFRDFDKDSLEPKLRQLYEDLRASVGSVSPLGNFQGPLRALTRLINYPVCAQILVNHPSWIPRGSHVHGRVMEVASILGPFLHISALPDHPVFVTGVDVRNQCFSESSSRRPGDLQSEFATIKTFAHQIYDGLKDVFLSLLKGNNTRDNALQYLAEVIAKNADRQHMQIEPFKCASSGMFLNLSAVMLRLCEPFLDASFTKMDRIDLNYVLHNSRLDLRGLTAINASAKEVKDWVKERNTSSGRLLSHAGQTKYPFICECFFMTARVLNLGLLKAMSEVKNIMQDLSRSQDRKAALNAMLGLGGSPQLEQDINRLNVEIERCTQARLCYEAQIIQDVELLQQGLTFYKLVLVWLVSLVGGFKLPLPADCPMEFASMPEHFVDDAMELLLFTSRIPKVLDGVILDEFMNFIIMFMASPLYIKNPYLRAKMVDVLNAWMPQKSDSRAMATLFEGHSLALEYLVCNLLKLYINIEFTGADNQFYDKFNIRHNIAELLEYLWHVPSHHNAWRQIARNEERGVYLNFLNFLINDSIFLLDESLNKIPELKKMEAELQNTVEWEQKSEEERQERMSHFHSLQKVVRIDMMLANEDVGMLAYTSDEITAPFLLPELVERVANMLNYFLLHLVGPQRKNLVLKDPEKYEFRPKQLLKQIVHIYVHLAREDMENAFSSAISKDGRSYKDELFPATVEILRKIGEDGKTIQEFSELGAKAKAAASQAMDIDAMLGDIPDEFLDPIQFTLMRDPVILPTSRQTMDRPTIQRHLLSDTSDPFNRSFLTPEMLIPNTELKEKIEEFIRSKTRNQD